MVQWLLHSSPAVTLRNSALSLTVFIQGDSRGKDQYFGMW